MAPSKDHESNRIQLVLEILDHWEVAPAEQFALLGMPDGTRARTLTRLRQGTALPDAPDIDARIGSLLAIERALGSMFPHNAAMGKYWITTPHPLYQDRTPLQVMLDQGTQGMDHLARQLNGDGDWF